jgi:hypothetical protein
VGEGLVGRSGGRGRKRRCCRINGRDKEVVGWC